MEENLSFAEKITFKVLSYSSFESCLFKDCQAAHYYSAQWSFSQKDISCLGPLNNHHAVLRLSELSNFQQNFT